MKRCAGCSNRWEWFPEPLLRYLNVLLRYRQALLSFLDVLLAFQESWGGFPDVWTRFQGLFGRQLSVIVRWNDRPVQTVAMI